MSLVDHPFDPLGLSESETALQSPSDDVTPRDAAGRDVDDRSVGGSRRAARPHAPLVRQHDGSAALSRHDCRPSARRAASENKDVRREDEAFRLRRHAFGAR